MLGWHQALWILGRRLVHILVKIGRSAIHTDHTAVGTIQRHRKAFHSSSFSDVVAYVSLICELMGTLIFCLRGVVLLCVKVLLRISVEFNPTYTLMLSHLLLLH